MIHIRPAVPADAPVIQKIMRKAFSAYPKEIPPSSALDETIQSIFLALEKEEKALIAYALNEPVGMVRFTANHESLYFYRLSVVPEMQGNGIAKQLLRTLEKYACQNKIPKLLCKARMAIPKNIHLYRSLGFQICSEEIIHKPGGIMIKVATMEKNL